jgi:C-terminal processing protease CtpA/Prc
MVAILLVAGCQSSDASRDPASPDFKPSRGESTEITPSDAAFTARRNAVRATKSHADSNVLTEGEIVQLPKFVVNEKGFANYGFSIVTNEEVVRNGPVKWVQIGVVLPGSVADRHNLATGMKIVAIDNIPVTDFRRDDLLRALFERESGEHVRLLILSRSLGLLPIFVDLAGPPVLPH